MKIYTKTGDKGSTSLIGGKRVPKNHPRIDAYGTVDELMAFTALLRDQDAIDKQWKSVLAEVLDRLMSCASILAADCTDCKVKLPIIQDADIRFLEEQIDIMDEQLEPLTSFVLPGGHQAVSLCHVARTICRRAERLAISVAVESPLPENLVKYINRLSDFFFTFSRLLAKNLKIEQIPWKPRV
ncbi:MAG: cob(I)yrinic acid a,c-diamide adenosyltransferase [Tenuifilaceae bacterium]|nr:cob(I)yrinic acid a,c-diamide adenosyltransferase [Tenuifilaceae bacterium]